MKICFGSKANPDAKNPYDVIVIYGYNNGLYNIIIEEKIFKNKLVWLFSMKHLYDINKNLNSWINYSKANKFAEIIDIPAGLNEEEFCKFVEREIKEIILLKEII